MKAKKILTVEQRDRIKDKRLQKQYGISLARQNEMRLEQNNKCKTCQVEFTADNPPNTDHFHYKIHTRKLGKKNWEAVGVDERGLPCAIVTAWSPTKAAAVAGMKKLMGPGSVRGLLCRKCNRGLGYLERFFNAARQPENLLPVIEYFRARLNRS
jgi:hypothetical protein